MRTSVSLGIAVAVAAIAAGPAGATTSVAVVDRFGPTAVEVDPSTPVTIADDFDSDSFSVAGNSATAQLRAGATAAGVGVGFDVFSFGSFVSRVGDPLASGRAYRLTVNHRGASVGADDIRLVENDYAQWSPLAFADFGTPELSIVTTSDIVPVGSSVRITVLAHDVATGAGSTAAGATVRFGDRTATTGGAGTATFLALSAGPLVVEASRAASVSSPPTTVCAFAGDPSACGVGALPAAGSAGSPGAAGPERARTVGAAGATADAVPPGSRVIFPRIGRSHRAVRAIRGTAGPDRSDISGVEVALARRVGTQCRFRTRSRSFTKPRSCVDRLYLTARQSGAHWLLPVARASLPRGLYRVWSRATDGAGNRERVGLARVNTGQFRIRAAKRLRAPARRRAAER